MAQPTSKDISVDRILTDIFGFDRRDYITENRCVPPPVGCGGPAERFNDDLSRKEYTISGLCQDCQNRIFGQGEEDWEEEPVDLEDYMMEQRSFRPVQ